MALSTRIKSLERAEARVCPICQGKTEATLVIRRKVVKTPGECSTQQKVSSECPGCGRKIRITRVKVVQNETG
jgi:hypothetical protein